MFNHGTFCAFRSLRSCYYNHFHNLSLLYHIKVEHGVKYHERINNEKYNSVSLITIISLKVCISQAFLSVKFFNKKVLVFNTVYVYNKNVINKTARKAKHMTTAQKVRRAKELVQSEQDGSTYLQTVCTVKELKDVLSHTRNALVKDIIQDAITIRQHNNEMKRRNLYVPLQVNS